MAKGRKKVLQINEVGNTGADEKVISQELTNYVSGKQEIEPIKDRIIEVFNDTFVSLDDWRQKVNSIDIKDGTDAKAMEIAKESKNFLVKARTGLERTVKAEIDEIKKDMEPYEIKIKVWKTMFDFAASSLRSLQDVAEQKAKHLEIQRQKRIEETRKQRFEQSETYRNFLPPMVDIGTLTDEEWQKTLKNAITLYEVDKKEREKEAEEAIKKEKEAKLALTRANRQKSMFQIGMEEKENKKGLYYIYPGIDEEIITEQDLEMDDNEWNDFFVPIFKKIEIFKDKIRKEKEAEEEANRKKADMAEAILKTKEFLVNKGMTLNETEDAYEYKNTGIVVEISTLETEDKEGLRNIMINTSRKIQDEIEQEKKRADLEAEKERQKTAQRIIGLKAVTVSNGDVVYTKKDLPKNVNIILGSLNEISKMTDDEYSKFSKDHEARVKEDNAEFDRKQKAIDDEAERIKNQKLSDNEKFKKYADEIHEIKVRLNKEEFLHEDSRRFSEKIIDSILDIVERIDSRIGK